MITVENLIYVKETNEVDIETFLDDNQNDDEVQCTKTSISKTKKEQKPGI